jgi:predicted nuclease of predicted toxin-antitoxin system
MLQRIRFHTDEHVARVVVRGLRRRGADVLTASESRLLGARDEEHLRRARAEGRVLFTQDEEFLRLHATGAERAGIAYAPQGASIGESLPRQHNS